MDVAMSTILTLPTLGHDENGESLGDRAYQAIRRAIITCALPPGSEVSETQLATRFGFGKAPVRAALSRLAQDRLVRAQARRGWKIAPVTLRDVRDIFDLRQLLESEAARLAAGQVAADELTRLDAACQARYVPGDPNSADSFLASNREFHLLIARRSGNARLASMLEQLMMESERLLHIGLALRDRTDEISHEHHCLIDALVAGDSVEAARIAAEQVADSFRMVRDAILSSDPIDTLSIRLETRS
jgi:DNA-binding GntR family transcriptional regulator